MFRYLNLRRRQFGPRVLKEKKSTAIFLLYLDTLLWIETDSRKAGLFQSGSVFPKRLLVPNSSLNCQIN